MSAGRSEDELPAPAAGSPATRPGRRFSLTDDQAQTLYAADDVLADTGATPEIVKELIDFGLVSGSQRAGATYFDENEREIIRAVTELVALRRLRAQPARAQDLGRPRVVAARADLRSGAAIAQHRTPR